MATTYQVQQPSVKPDSNPTTFTSSSFTFPGLSSNNNNNNNNTHKSKRTRYLDLSLLDSVYSKYPQTNTQQSKMNWLDDIYNLTGSQLDVLKSKYANSFDAIHPDYLFKNINIHFDYMTDAESKDSTMTDSGYRFVNHYTIGDLSKYMLIDKLKSSPPQFCQYDVLDRFKKDLLVCGLINDPFSYKNMELRLRTNLIHTMNQITTNDLRNSSTIFGDTKIITYLKDTTQYADRTMESQNTTSLQTFTGGANPYTKSLTNNKLVQWNTLYGEFLHDFITSRITSVNHNLFFGDNTVEEMVNAGWDNVLKNAGLGESVTTNTDYDFIRAKTLYNSQPLNETKYVQETIKTIQNNNPDLLYDLDYTPLTTFSTAYYPNNMTDDDDTNKLNTEISQLYDTFTTSFYGSIIIPRKKVKGGEYCIVFYVFHPKQDYEESKISNTYKNVELQMTDMNIDQNAVSARLLYSQIEEFTTPSLLDENSPTPELQITPTQIQDAGTDKYIKKWFHDNKTLKFENIESVTNLLDQNIPTLVTYSKGLDPITQSTSMELTSIPVGDNTIYTITQDTNVFLYFKDIVVRKPEHTKAKYITIINNYLTNKLGEVSDDFESDNVVFAKLLLESTMGQATIESMNDLLSIWFDGFSKSQIPDATVNIDDVAVSVTETPIDTTVNRLDTFVQLLDGEIATTEYNQIKFMKKTTAVSHNTMNVVDPDLSKAENPDSFMFQMGSTTVNNVAQALVEIHQIYKADTYKQTISSFKSNNTELINYANSTPITDKALQSFILYFIQHIPKLHYQFNEISFVSALLMFIAFAKSCGDELQRLTCEKMNDLLEETVFVLTRDRIFVAKCLAEYTPCISTIILDQLAEDEDDETKKNTGLIKGGARQGSVQTHGGILISPITAVLAETKSEKDILNDKLTKLGKLKIELTKRIYAKLDLDIPTLTDAHNIFTITGQYVSMSNTSGNIEMGPEETAKIETQKRQIWEFNQHIPQLTGLLESIELYTPDDANYTKTKAIIDVEINTLALRLLTSAEKQFIQQTGTAFPSNTKNIFNAIHILSGNEDITTKLLEIYTTATNCILTRIQLSKTQLQIIPNTPVIYTKIINSVIPTYDMIETYIVTEHNKFLDTVVSKLEIERQALEKRENQGRSRTSSSASYITGPDDNIVNKIENIEAEIANINHEIKILTDSTNTDSNEINDLLAIPHNPDAEKKLNEIGKKYNSFSQKVASQMSNLFKSFKNTSKGIQNTATKLLASINKIKDKRTDEFIKERDKLVSIIEKQKSRIKQPPPRQTTTTLRTIIDRAKEAYSKMHIVLKPSTSQTEKTPAPKRPFFIIGKHGGKHRNTFKRNNTSHNNRRSNRRIRKIGVLTKKRHNKPQIHRKPKTHKHKSTPNDNQ